MAWIDNIRRIVKEDFDPKYHDLIDRLAYVLNTFMDQTVSQVNGNLDIENLSADIVTVNMIVNTDGVPIGNNLIKSTVSRPTGTTVKRAINLTDSTEYAESQPFISYTTGTNSNVIKVLHISGLQADQEYQLVIKIE